MTLLEKCLATLRPLIASGEQKGIRLAEAAVDGYVAEVVLPARRGALADLKAAVQWRRAAAGATSAQGEFAQVVMDYVDKKTREL